MLRIDNLHKSFDNFPVLKGVSLEIAEGERFVLLGPSGCGKTTLLRCIAGFEATDTGVTFVANKAVNALPVENRPVGFIFQRHALFPHMNVYDNIAVGPRTRKIPEKEIDQQVTEMLSILKLTSKRNAWPLQISGGESQRVALARALINRPQVLLLDEPLSSLDATLRKDLRDELIEMQEAFGITFLFVTHDREEALSLAHRVGILNEGKLVQVGTPDELYENPASPFVTRFLGDFNRFEGIVEEKTGDGVKIRTHEGNRLFSRSTTSLTQGEACVCYIRPENILLADARDPSTRPPNTWIGMVTQRSVLGSRVQYRVQLLSGKPLTVETGFASSIAGWTSGHHVRFSMDENAMHLFPLGDDA